MQWEVITFKVLFKITHDISYPGKQRIYTIFISPIIFY